MALTRAIADARRNTATHANRQRQLRAELRLDEIVKVAGIADEYDRIDGPHDEAIRRAFATVYHVVDSESEKEAVAAAFATWMKYDARKDAGVRTEVDGSVSVLKVNNPVWIDGAAVPSDSDGAA